MTGSVAFDTIMEFGGRFGDHILPDKTNELNVAFLVDRLERRRGRHRHEHLLLDGAARRSGRCSARPSGGGDFVDYAAALGAEGVDMSAVLHVRDVGTATAFITTDRDGNQITAFHPGAMARAAGVDLSGLSDHLRGDRRRRRRAAPWRCISSRRERSAPACIFVPAQQIPAMPDAVLRRGLEQAWIVARQRLRVRDDPRADRAVHR